LSKLDFKTLWRTRPIFKWLLAVELILLIAIAVLAISFVQDPTPLPFNSEIWDFGVGPTRYSMVQDLIGSGRLIGKDVEQLEKLLGTRLSEKKVVDNKVVQLSYVMSRGLKEAYLDLDFNDGHCVGAQIRRPVEAIEH
jgi:hypothetical protein